MGEQVVMQRWELYALVAGLACFGVIAGMPLGVAFFTQLTSGRSLAARTEHDLRNLTHQALKRKDA
jgi:hypothetical protein